MLLSLAEDTEWHSAWTQALIGMLLRDTPTNARVIHGWIDAWRARTVDAACGPLSASGEQMDLMLPRLELALDRHLALCGLTHPQDVDADRP